MTLATDPSADGRLARLEAYGRQQFLGLPAPVDEPMPRLGVLYSYEAGEKTSNRALAFARSRGVRSILDSGAWSVFNNGATIDPVAHAKYVVDVAPEHPLTRFIGLDVIGDDPQSYRNWMMQREAGAPVEPTIHYGEHPDFITRYVDAGLAVNGAGETWINCGGMVAASSRPSWIRPTMAWVAAVRARLPEHVKIHGLGMTTPSANDLVRFDGVDSTYWVVSYARFRNLPLFNPERRSWILFQLMTSSAEYTRGSRAGFKGHGRVLRELYGVTPAEVWEMNDNERLELSIRSHAYFADTYRARHKDPTAPVVYLASAPSSETAGSAVLMDPIARWARSNPRTGEVLT